MKVEVFGSKAKSRSMYCTTCGCSRFLKTMRAYWSKQIKSRNKIQIGLYEVTNSRNMWRKTHVISAESLPLAWLLKSLRCCDIWSDRKQRRVNEKISEQTWEGSPHFTPFSERQVCPHFPIARETPVRHLPPLYNLNSPHPCGTWNINTNLHVVELCRHFLNAFSSWKYVYSRV